MRKSILIIPVLLTASLALAQQEAIFSQFFYNKIAANPGAAGSANRPCLTAFHRQQWAGLEGAPVTQSLSFQSPAFGNRVGLGAMLMNDRIGFFNATFLNLSYAYRISFGNGKLGIGVMGSYLHQRIDWAEAKTISQNADPTATSGDLTPVFNVGAGVHFENERFFAGIAVPHILEKGLTENNAGIVSDFSGTTPHLFLSAGAFIELPGKVKMRPAFTARFAKNAPPDTDVHLGFGFLEETKLWIGGTYRWSRSKVPSYGDAAVLTSQYQLSNRLRAGIAYDLALNSLRRENAGTYELMLEYCFVKTGNGVRNPRFF